jgi:tRNA 5-methylaminomethyl-2-thiouridine biosynthesis bifunctional protein
LQVAEDRDEEARFETIAKAQGYPPAFLHHVDGASAAQIAGRPVSRGGWWFPGGAVVSIASLLVASQACGGRRHAARVRPARGAPRARGQRMAHPRSRGAASSPRPRSSSSPMRRMQRGWCRKRDCG